MTKTRCCDCHKTFTLPVYALRDTLTEEMCPDCIASMRFDDSFDFEAESEERQRMNGHYDTASDGDYRDAFSER